MGYRLRTVAGIVFVLMMAAAPLLSNAAKAPLKVGKIYVGSFGMGDDANELRTMLGYELGRRGFKVVDFEQQADQVLSGLLAMKVAGGKTTARVTVFLKARDGNMLWNDDIGGTAAGTRTARESLQQRANDIAEALKAKAQHARGAPKSAKKK